ncbi:MAG: Rha family transcriptional regulator [Pseudomonadota bacterium]
MTDIEIYSDNQEIKTNSKNVADVFGKNHRDVLRDIKKLDCSDEFRARNFALSSYISEQNKELPCVEMTKDGFTFLCMGYRGDKAAKFKEGYISEFNRMANSLNSISNRVNKLSIEGKKITELGKEWSSLGHEVRRAKKEHKKATNSLMNEVQLKLEI